MRAFISSAIFFFAFSAFAKTVVISDIDDTIRSFHSTADYFELFDNASDPHRAFRGLSEIFSYLDQAGMEIYYVSAVVDPFVGMSENFLETNGFAQRENFFYKGWFEDTVEFKVARIEEILNSTAPDEIILIGDNGDHDVEVYSRIAGEYPNVHSFIHKLYQHNPIDPGQAIYLTGADLAVQFEARGWLTPDQSGKVLSGLMQDLSSEDAYVLEMLWPSWGETTATDVTLAFSASSSSPENQNTLETIKESLF
jgi:hypothetical protein